MFPNDPQVPLIEGVQKELLNIVEFVECGSGEKIPKSFLNDDYCDCQDGSDETKTPACSNGKFVCVESKNVISSYKLYDGVCDCCDGSDENFETSNCNSKTCV